MNKTYTVKEVAEILGYSTNSIYTFIKEKRIKGIRVGLGRFRITQNELNRLLNEKKTSFAGNEASTNMSEASHTSKVNLVEPQADIPSLVTHRENVIISTPSLFDWFLSIANIVTGFGILLFMNQGKYAGSLYYLFFPIGAALTMLGIIFFIRNSVNNSKKGVTSLFTETVTGFLYLSLSFLFIINKDVHGAVFYSLLAFVIFLQMVFYDLKTNFFLVYFSLISILLPIVVYMFPGFINLHDYPIIFSYSSWLMILIWFIFSLFSNLIIWATKKNSAFFNVFFIILMNVNLTIIANIYGINIYWERTYLLVFISVFSLISFYYEKIDKNENTKNLTFFNSFFQMVIIACVILALVFLNQKNILNSLRSEVLNELTYGKLIVDNTLQISKEQLKDLSLRDSFVKTVKNKDINSINAYLKGLYISSNVFRRVLIADKDGNILSLYPQATLGNINISFRDYFSATKQLRDSYVTDPFDVVVNGKAITSVSVTAPVIDSNREFIGIVIGSLDLNKLSDDLQKYTNSADKYFQLIDKTGQIFVKPSYRSLPSNLNKNSVIWEAFNGNYNSTEQYTNNMQALISYDRMPATNWVISLQIPVTGVYRYGTINNLLAVTILIITNLFVVFVNYKKNKK